MRMLRERIEVVRMIPKRLAAPIRLAVAMAVVIVACEAPTPTESKLPGEPTPATTAGPRTGGTIYLLTRNKNWLDVDPQRIVAPEDVAFFSGTIYRSLLTYAYSPDAIEGTTLQPDLAADLGVPSDGGLTWTFTLRDGLTWEDGSALSCRDIAYGISRTFATDVTGGGPAHALRYLDIPTVDGWANDRARNPQEATASAYAGPYDENLRIFADRKLSKTIPSDVAAFNRAVACSGNTITFRLNRPIGDFNDATTVGMFPVPNPSDHPDLVDPGEGYGSTSTAWSSGPYRVERYDPGVGGTMVLVRNEHWAPASDPNRKAYPDRWVVELGLDPRKIDERLLAPAGDDEFAVQSERVQPENLPTIFADSATAKADFQGRALSGFDRSTHYFWINVEKIPGEKIRQAMMVALDREGMRQVFGDWYGGPAYAGLYGDYADGLVKPSIGLDYAPTGIWDTYFGKAVPPSGDPELARQLITQSGEEPPTLRWNYAESEIGQQLFAVVRDSLDEAGFTVENGSIPPLDCLCPPDVDGDFGNMMWGSAWPSASTVIPPALFMPIYDSLPPISDDAFELAVEDAVSTLDRAEQARKWQALSREAVQKAWVIPTFFTRSQMLSGGKVGPIYRWPAYASWPYGVMYVTD